MRAIEVEFLLNANSSTASKRQNPSTCLFSSLIQLYSIVLRNVLENLKSILVFGGVDWAAIVGVKRPLERLIPEKPLDETKRY